MANPVLTLEKLKELTKDILETLPLAHYLRVSTIPVFFSETEPSSYFNRQQFIIVVALNNIINALNTKAQNNNNQITEGDLEKTIRCFLYHEVSHAILTPANAKRRADELHTQYKYVLTANLENIIEDERIETILKHYYLNVDFKRNLHEAVRLEPATNFEHFVFNAVRFRYCPIRQVEVNERIKAFIENTKAFNSTSYVDTLLYHMELLCQYLLKVWNEWLALCNANQKSQNGNKQGQTTKSQPQSNQDTEGDEDDTEDDSQSECGESDQETEDSQSESDDSDNDTNDDIEDDTESEDADDTDTDDDADDADDSESDTDNEDDIEDDSENEDDTDNDNSDDTEGDQDIENDSDSSENEENDSSSNDQIEEETSNENAEQPQPCEDECMDDDISEEMQEQMRMAMEDAINLIKQEAANNGSYSMKLSDFTYETETYANLLSIIIKNKGFGNNKTPIKYGYSGKFNTKRYISDLRTGQESFKWFKMKSFNNDNQDKKAHKKILNIFLDNSGSFSGNDYEVNKVLSALSKIETKVKDFEFRLIRWGNYATIEKGENRFSHSDMGTCLDPTFVQAYHDTNKTNQEYNIFLTDGQIGWGIENIKLFNNNRSVIISQGSNVPYMKKTCPNCRAIIREDYNYTSQLKINIQKALESLF